MKKRTKIKKNEIRIIKIREKAIIELFHEFLCEKGNFLFGMPSGIDFSCQWNIDEETKTLTVFAVNHDLDYHNQKMLYEKGASICDDLEETTDSLWSAKTKYKSYIFEDE